jgi:hypothetical protein
MPPEGRVTDEPQGVVEAPSAAERRAFRLLPLVWLAAFVLAGIILYLVFR